MAQRDREREKGGGGERERERERKRMQASNPVEQTIVSQYVLCNMSRPTWLYLYIGLLSMTSTEVSQKSGINDPVATAVRPRYFVELVCQDREEHRRTSLKHTRPITSHVRYRISWRLASLASLCNSILYMLRSVSYGAPEGT